MVSSTLSERSFTLPGDDHGPVIIKNFGRAMSRKEVFTEFKKDGLRSANWHELDKLCWGHRDDLPTPIVGLMNVGEDGHAYGHPTIVHDYRGVVVNNGIWRDYFGADVWFAGVHETD